jgi:hypothetical protein
MTAKPGVRKSLPLQGRNPYAPMEPDSGRSETTAIMTFEK